MYITVPHFVAVSQTVWAQAGGLKKFGDAWARPPLWHEGLADALETSLWPVLPHQISSLCVKPIGRNHGNPPVNFDPFCPDLSRSLMHHWNRHGSIGCP